MSEDVAVSRRGVLGLVLTLLAALGALSAPPLVWWLGLVLWREVASCDPPSPLTTIFLTCGLAFLAVGVGVVPALSLDESASRWLPWVALLSSLIVLGLYTLIMASATSFGLAGHPERVSAAIPDVFVSYVPSLAITGSAAISLLARRSPRGMFVALSSWTLLITVLGLVAAFAVQATCAAAL